MKDEKIPRTRFLFNSGVLLCLTLGFSLLTFAELLYHFLLLLASCLGVTKKNNESWRTSSYLFLKCTWNPLFILSPIKIWFCTLRKSGYQDCGQRHSPLWQNSKPEVEAKIFDRKQFIFCLGISMSSASCETELAEWKGGATRKDSNQVVHSRYCFSLASKSGFYSSFKKFLAIKYNCNWLFKTSPAGFPANLRQHTGAWVLQRFLTFFINFYFLELSCETFTLGEVSYFLF